jgi:N-acetylmuramoyl-L-alanine amidase
MNLGKLFSKAFAYAVILILSLSGIQPNKTYAAELPMRLQLDTNVQGTTLSGNVQLVGWALSSSGVQKVEFSIDGGTKEQGTYGTGRSDVGAVFPDYGQAAANSGFTYNLNSRRYLNGNHSLNIVVTGNDGKVTSGYWVIYIENQQTPIMGQTIATKEQAIRYFLNRNYIKGYEYINNFVNILWEEAGAEGIRADIAFAQMMKETAFLKFGGDVLEEQNNFAGIGAVGGGVRGEYFKDIRTGIRASVQHLKAYASKEPLKQEVVDPRYGYVTKGSTPYVEWLGKGANPNGYGWAISEDYGYDIVNRVNAMKSLDSSALVPMTADIKSFYADFNFETERSYSITGAGISANKILYQYWIKDYSTNTWKLMQDFSENGVFLWKPEKAGNYRIELHVKDQYSSREFDNLTFKDVTVKPLQINNFKVMLDSGHGGTEPGATYFGYKEKDINARLTKKLSDKLKALGVTVMYTRNPEIDSTLSLTERTDIANKQPVDIFLSIHHNGSSDSSINGIETHYSSFRPAIETKDAYAVYNGKKYEFISEVKGGYNIKVDDKEKFVSINEDITIFDATPSSEAKKSAELAKKLVNAVSGLGFNNRGIFDHNLHVTRWTNTTSVLIETGYMSNKDELDKMTQADMEDKIADKIANTLVEFYKS